MLLCAAFLDSCAPLPDADAHLCFAPTATACQIRAIGSCWSLHSRRASQNQAGGQAEPARESSHCGVVGGQLIPIALTSQSPQRNAGPPATGHDSYRRDRPLPGGTPKKARVAPAPFVKFESADDIHYTPETALATGLGMVQMLERATKKLQLGSKLRQDVWEREIELQVEMWWS